MRTAGDLFFYTTQQTCANAWGIPHPVGVYRVSLKVTTQNNHGYQQSMGEVIISQAVQHVRAVKSLPLPLTLPPVKAEDAVKASYPLVPPPTLVPPPPNQLLRDRKLAQSQCMLFPANFLSDSEGEFGSTELQTVGCVLASALMNECMVCALSGHCIVPIA